MMLYIFRTIRLFPINESLEEQLTSLEDELIELLEKYYKWLPFSLFTAYQILNITDTKR